MVPRKDGWEGGLERQGGLGFSDLDRLPYPVEKEREEIEECSWPPFRQQLDGNVIPVLKPRYDYQRDVMGYTAYNPKERWENILDRTPLAQEFGTIDEQGKLKESNYEEINKKLEKDGEVFLQTLVDHQKKEGNQILHGNISAPFFYFARDYVKEAYILAAAVHHGQKRESGDPYMVHVKGVVFKFLEMVQHADAPLPLDLTREIMVLLLHDTIEDASYRHWIKGGLLKLKKDHYLETTEETKIEEARHDVWQYIQRCFKVDIAAMIKDLTKFSKKKKIMEYEALGRSIQRSIFETLEVEAARGEQLTKEEDRVKDFIMLIVDVFSQKPPSFVTFMFKLADRLHNLGTLDAFIDNPEKQKRIAQETLYWYVPVAILLGLNNEAKTMEDICYPYIYSKKEFGSLQSQHTKVIKHYEKIYTKEAERITAVCRQMGVSWNIECRTDRLGRLISAYQMFMESYPQQEISFEQFLHQFKSPLKIAIVIPDSQDTSESELETCTSALDLLKKKALCNAEVLPPFINISGTHIKSDQMMINPVTNQKIEVVYFLKNDQTPITLKIVTSRMDRKNLHGKLEKHEGSSFLQPAVDSHILKDFLRTLSCEIKSKEVITKEDLEKVREQLKIFREASLGSFPPQLIQPKKESP